jgi:low affinity Fe/Cu permease
LFRLTYFFFAAFFAAFLAGFLAAFFVAMVSILPCAATQLLQLRNV